MATKKKAAKRTVRKAKPKPPKPVEPDELLEIVTNTKAMSSTVSGWPEMGPGTIIQIPATDPIDTFVAAVVAYTDYRDRWSVHEFTFQGLGPHVKLADKDVRDALLGRITRAAEEFQR